MKALKGIIRSLAVIAPAVTVWWITVLWFQVPQYLFPGPEQVFDRFVANFASYIGATAVTLCEAAIGLCLALIATTLVGVIFSLSKQSDRYVSPVLVAMQSVPILAVAPLLTMWFGTGFSSKAIAAFLVCFFPLAAGWSSGIQSVRQDERDLFVTMGASRVQIAFLLVAPRALPYFFAGLRVAAPLSVLGAIVGEFVGAQKGLGFLILSHSYYARTADMFVCIIIISLCGILLHKAVTAVENRALFWRGEEKH